MKSNYFFTGTTSFNGPFSIATSVIMGGYPSFSPRRSRSEGGAAPAPRADTGPGRGTASDQADYHWMLVENPSPWYAEMMICILNHLYLYFQSKPQAYPILIVFIAMCKYQRVIMVLVLLYLSAFGAPEGASNHERGDWGPVAFSFG